jgi:hypothetical protein
MPSMIQNRKNHGYWVLKIGVGKLQIEQIAMATVNRGLQ